MLAVVTGLPILLAIGLVMCAFYFLGAVRRLKELCMRFVRSYSNVYNINLIPPGLRNELIEEDTLFPMLFYYHELPKQSVLKL